MIVPAHIASYYTKFCAEFVGSLRKPYLIDPMTYLFAGDPALLKRFVKDRTTGRTKRDRSGRKRKGDLKRSYLKLIEQEYGGFFEPVIADNRPVAPSDFKNSNAVDEFVGRVVDFQTNRLASLPDKYKKYAKYVAAKGEEGAVSSNPPMCVVPPYFAIDGSKWTEWLDINTDLASRTKAVSDQPVFPIILANASTLSLNATTIIARYTEAEPDGFFLWVDGFSSDQDVAALRAVFEFVSRLSKLGKPVLLLYGDAFSLALHFAGLKGFACGICYAEKKLSSQDVDVEGMIPPRYYVSLLKRKYQIETEARRIDLTQYDDLRCACEICQRKPDPADLDDAESREHFMLVRRSEIEQLRSGLQQQELTEALSSAFQAYASDPLFAPLAHLRNWASLLSEK